MRFLRLPVDRGKAGIMKLTVNGEERYAFHIAYAPKKPEYDVWADLLPWMGQEIELTFEGERAEGVFCDEPGPFAGEEGRPLAHFTAPWGWINDPNGLSFYRGKYRLFCQHNPFGDRWGNMHWGYAESEDLLHWHWKGEALYPDRIDATMFSGSAVVDENDTAGFGKGAHILFYTCADDQNGFSQHLAWSTDGETYHKYDKNPVIPNLAPQNRDPKVIWHEATGRWIMALYLEKDIFALFASENLREWQELQRLHFPGGNECPDFFPLCTPEGEEKWILWEAGAKYLIGDFDGYHFTYEEKEKELASREAAVRAYAAQTIFGDPKGRRILVFWELTRNTGACFTGQLSVPLALSLIRQDGELMLKADLCEEVKQSAEEFPLVINTALASPLTVGGHTFTRTSNGVALDGEEIPCQSGPVTLVIDRNSAEMLSGNGTHFDLWERRFL